MKFTAASSAYLPCFTTVNQSGVSNNAPCIPATAARILLLTSGMAIAACQASFSSKECWA